MMDRSNEDRTILVNNVTGIEPRKNINHKSQQHDHLKFIKLYGFLTLVSWPLLFIYYLLRILTGSKYRLSCLYRMGLKLPRSLPPRDRIWFHALSVGETLSVLPLVKAVRRICPGLEIVFSTATESGQQIARERLAEDIDRFLYLPHDFAVITGIFVHRLNPSMFVLVETDTWPNLLQSLRRRNIPTVLVNGRLSPGSAEHFQALSGFFSPFRFFDQIFPQSIQDKERFLALGVAPGRIQEPGNLKIDSLLTPVSDAEKRDLQKATGIEESRRVWIAGSTHKGEEEILLRAHKRLQQVHRGLLLIIAPRHVARTKEIESLASRLSLSSITRSFGPAGMATDIYLLDTLGELGKFYALADVAFIGGSFVPFGGHNPLEAIAQGKPCLWGPHLFNFREIEAKLLEAGCATQVSSEEELVNILGDWIGSASSKEKAWQSAQSFIASNTGCAQRIAEFLCEEIDCEGKKVY